ncbi:MAG: 16S rRNA (adenine(1518)-N(6)/adenine(1519)-N(6))-dimethyltransferase RsmA [Alphaproteobacteria bacterium]
MTALEALPPLRAVLETQGLSPRKSLGQHFLFDLNLTRRIARAAGPLQDHVVFEVGPGPGGLTRALLLEGAGHVIAIERDARCAGVLDEIAAAAPGRLTRVDADALTVHEPALMPQALAGRPAKVVANLPYNVGTALVVRWLTGEAWPPWYTSLTLMLQKEVVERLVAAPGSKAYGRLSVLAQWRARARHGFDVPAAAFVPPPKVASAVGSITPGEPVLPCPPAALERITAAAFGQRRKMLRGSLKAVTPAPEALIEAAGLAPTQRAEEVDVAGFCRLASALAGKSASERSQTG